jgi:uncharacterized membrane protein
MSTTAWCFSDTEGADSAVATLTELGHQKVMEVQDVTVIRWPEYASEPTVQEHVTQESGKKVTSFFKNLGLPDIDKSMIEAVRSDLTPGTSALVLLSSDTALDAVTAAFKGQTVELIRSDLSIKQEDMVRAAFSKSAGTSKRSTPKRKS